jgi:hypothetical protein
MKLSFGQGILVRNSKEADFIWKKLLLLGYKWCSHSKDFKYYEQLPIIIYVRSNKRLIYTNYRYGEYEYEINYTIDDFKHLSFLDLE